MLAVAGHIYAVIFAGEYNIAVPVDNYGIIDWHGIIDWQGNTTLPCQSIMP